MSTTKGGGEASEKQQHSNGELDLAGESDSCKKLRKGQENLMPMIGWKSEGEVEGAGVRKGGKERSLVWIIADYS